MKLSLEYRGFSGSAHFDRKSGRHFGMVLDRVDCVVYQSLSAEGLIANFEAAVDEYIEFQSHLDENDHGEMTSRPTISISVTHAANVA